MHFPPLPPSNVEMWFQSYVAKTTLQKRRENNMEQKTQVPQGFWMSLKD